MLQLPKPPKAQNCWRNCSLLYCHCPGYFRNSPFKSMSLKWK